MAGQVVDEAAQVAETALTNEQVVAIVREEFGRLSKRDKCYALLSAAGVSLGLDLAAFLAHDYSTLLGLLTVETPLLPLLGRYCR